MEYCTPEVASLKIIRAYLHKLSISQRNLRLILLAELRRLDIARKSRITPFIILPVRRPGFSIEPKKFDYEPQRVD